MDWNRIEGNWSQLKGGARARWLKLTDDHLVAIGGNREMLIDRLRELYGITRETTERQIAQWQADQREPALQVAVEESPDLKDVQ